MTLVQALDGEAADYRAGMVGEHRECLATMVAQRATEEGAAQRLLLTVSEAAHLLGIGRSLFYELLADGQVESIHVGRLRRIPADALSTYIDRQRQGKPSTAM